MFNRKYPFIIPLKREATSTTTFTAKTQSWRKGDVVRIDAVAVTVDAHNPKTVHVGVTRDEHVIYFETLVLTNANTFYVTGPSILVPSGYKVIVKCVSPTAGVLYTINVFGCLIVCVKE